MREMILCKLGEVVLKGLNRRSFEDKLIGNLRRRTAKCGNFRIYSKQSTIYVEPVNDESDLTAAYTACKQVFGVIAVSRALPCEKDVQAIIRTAKDYLAPEFARAKDFKVESKRADKTFPLTSIQLSQQVGGALHQAFPRCAVVHAPFPGQLRARDRILRANRNVCIAKTHRSFLAFSGVITSPNACSNVRPVISRILRIVYIFISVLPLRLLLSVFGKRSASSASLLTFQSLRCIQAFKPGKIQANGMHPFHVLCVIVCPLPER